MVQASNGNTSIKLDGTLWIKASGKWLAHTMRDDLFIPMPLAEVNEHLQRDIDISSRYSPTHKLRPSIETAMHAIIHHRVVIHVHSINAVAWSIRVDGLDQLKDRLAGLNWQWIPYAPSGIPLARGIERAITRTPEADVFVLANHGLVVCGPDCHAAERLLNEVEERLTIIPRRSPKPNHTLLAVMSHLSGWQFPDIDSLHALGTDPVARKAIKGGVLYPCQAIFLGERMPVLSPALVASKFTDRWNGKSLVPAFVIMERVGVLLNPGMTAAEQATLIALSQVIQRTEESALLCYLNAAEVTDVLSKNLYGYKKSLPNGEERNTATLMKPPARNDSWLQLRP